MSPRELCVLLDGVLVGRVLLDGRHRFRFVYEASWRNAGTAYPLSLSLPLAAEEHAHAPIEAFMWDLLPDNDRVLDRWAQRFQVSSGNPFALLAHVGEDCAGAVQFVLPERLPEVEGEGAAHVEWLEGRDVAERLRSLQGDHAAWRMATDNGQFSLAGAQPKTALCFARGRWGVPSGRAPTTHILKPPLAHLDGHAENEHLCLALASELGLPAAASTVQHFEDQRAIVVERYDRVLLGTKIRRVHQEDLCRALAVLPSRKYQNEGGPAPTDIAKLLRAYSSRPDEDLATFVDALLFNWMIVGTDGHAKNYSILLAARGRVRLAPLYDLGSALPYRNMDQRRLKLAMKLGGTYRIREVATMEVRRLASELNVDPDVTLERARALATQVGSSIRPLAKRERDRGLEHPIVESLVERMEAHASWCLRALS